VIGYSWVMVDGGRTVVLVGLMGSGKSAVGQLVAAALGRLLIDVDDVIEARTGQTVGELWKRGGEAAYRPLERQIVVDALAQETPVVLAAPGGVIDDDDLVARLGSDHLFVVFLRGQVATLAARVRADEQERPLVGDDPASVLQHQAKGRNPRFEQLAALTLDLGDRSPNELAGLVLASLRSGTR
jgi:shikimate kinase